MFLNLSFRRLPCTHISALTPSVPLSQKWARGRPDKAFRLPFAQNGRRGWGMRARRIVIFRDYSKE